MKTITKFFQATITGCLIVCLSFFVFSDISLAGTTSSQSPSCGEAQGTVSFTVDFSSGSDQTNIEIDDAPWTKNSTVSLVMDNLEYLGKIEFETDFSCPYGDLVTSINSVLPGTNQYWALFINGSLSDYGIDSAILDNGDAIEWQILSY
jgi:hypothetical protein